MIRLIVTDIDGCILEGGLEKFPLGFFLILQNWNAESRCNPLVPPISLCTGRPQPFSEAIVRSMDGYMPIICESGGIFYDMMQIKTLISPSFNNGADKKIADLRRAVENQFTNGTRPIIIEPGKFTEITLIPYTPLNADMIWEEAQNFIQPYTDNFSISRTKRVINFSHKAVNKGKGLLWLVDMLQIPKEQMAGFGDAKPDISFLKEVGFAGCPSNAEEEVQQSVHFVSRSSSYLGFL